MDTILASFQSFGKMPSRKDLLNNMVRDGTIWSAVSFSRCTGIPLDPVALSTSSCLRVADSLHPPEGAPIRCCCNFLIFEAKRPYVPKQRQGTGEGEDEGEAKSLICSLVGAFLPLSRDIASLWLPLPGWYGCAHALGTGQTMGWCLSLSLAFIVVFKTWRSSFTVTQSS